MLAEQFQSIRRTRARRTILALVVSKTEPPLAAVSAMAMTVYVRKLGIVSFDAARRKSLRIVVGRLGDLCRYLEEVGGFLEKKAV